MRIDRLDVLLELDELGGYVIVWLWLGVEIQSAANRVRVSVHPEMRTFRCSAN